MGLVKASELRQFGPDELAERLEKLRKENYELLQKKEIGQLDRPSRFKHIRKEIAQIQTVLNEKQRKNGS